MKLLAMFVVAIVVLGTPLQLCSQLLVIDPGHGGPGADQCVFI